ncbi:FecR domain-containing protein [Mucilaginibacter sp. JRF]|uniref:FecR family protein n=1 Tax=Mucilaginibacter sp. JRF TaxID=2780088 RepID=UPI0018815F44|nr:FecR family protein [Mucilaginibacter sp. JRF]MBE9584090.1 FecR domain-containing protein [Mucilaginibacter sp. JRF]
MNRYKFKRLLKRYQDGSANETERALVEAWYASYTQAEDKPLADGVRQKLLRNINSAIEPAISIAPQRRLYQYIRVAAAVLVFALIGAVAYHKLKPKPATVYSLASTKNGQIQRLVLQDSSAVWLNSATRLRFPEQFDGTLREIYLDEGEAFFDVKHDAKKPFIVHTSKVKVHVLGTSFNINAYHNMPELKVMVATGKVGVSTKNGRTIYLTPGQELMYNTSTGQYNQHKVDINAAQGWKTGIIYLRQATFAELAAVIKNQLGITIKAGSAEITGYRFTLPIQANLPAEQTLQMITQMHNTHYRKEGNDIVIY